MPGQAQWSVSADWIVPVDSPPIAHGVMRGRGRTIEAIGTERNVQHSTNHRAYEGAVVLPGLINLHTHLEQTHLVGKLRKRAYLDWFEGVQAGRLKGAEQDQAVADGIAQALAAGTTTVVDLSYNHRAMRILRKSPIRKVCLAELQDLDKPMLTFKALSRKVRGIRADAKLRLGLAVYAPWAASPELLEQAAALVAKRKWIFATHLAETEADRQFMLHRFGALAECRQRKGASDWPDDSFRGTPVAFMHTLGLLGPNSLLVHVSSIDGDDLAMLAKGKATVVYCPRAHRFLGRGAHRYADMLAAGCNVAIGTDGLAANDGLDMIEEMRQLRFDGKIDVASILQMATVNAAKALGMEDKLGTLTAGKQADYVVAQLGPNPGHPLESVLTLGGRILETVIAGESVYRDPKKG